MSIGEGKGAWGAWLAGEWVAGGIVLSVDVIYHEA